MTALLTNSRRLDWNELVLYIMQLDQPRLHRAVLEMEHCRFEHVRAELFPGVRLGEDSMP
ncbi:MAG: hypothetical protein M3O35_04425 [Acidobacteriota bacterium]|nr:hypothetical protein [Acidobacteriota bacterium]